MANWEENVLVDYLYKANSVRDIVHPVHKSIQWDFLSILDWKKIAVKYLDNGPRLFNGGSAVCTPI